LIKRIIDETKCPSKLTGTIIGHTLKNLDGRKLVSQKLTEDKIFSLFEYITINKIKPEIIKEVLPLLVKNPEKSIESVLKEFDYKQMTMDELLQMIPDKLKKFKLYSPDNDGIKATSWLMGQLRDDAIGNVSLEELQAEVEKVVNHG